MSVTLRSPAYTRGPLALQPQTGVPRLSIVIVNYCQWRRTAALVNQLRCDPSVERGEVEIVVVDNHSPPHRLMHRLRRWPGVSLRRWGRNRGFGRAVNEGVRLSQGPWLLLLNADIRVPPRFVQRMLGRMDHLMAEGPRTGIVGFQLRNSDGSRQLSAGRFPSLLGTVAGLALPRARRKYQPRRARRCCRVSWVSGCCLLVRRRCFEELNGFDPRYFLYYEDVDLCRRAHAQGWAVQYEPELHVIHHRPLHTRRVSPCLRVVTRHALLTYGDLHWPRWQFEVLAHIVRLEAWCRYLWACVRQRPAAAGLFAELASMAADLLHGRRRSAWRRLLGVLRAQDKASVCTAASP